MAEYAKMEDVLNALCTCECEDKKECLDYVLISNLPTIDIVHCSECRYHGLEEAPTYCRHWFERTGNDGYCFKGEKKNG